MPLSPAQERLAFIQRLDPGNAAFQRALALHLDGELDARRLGLALDRVAANHAPLRTSIVETNGGLCASVSEQGKLDLELLDLSALEEPERASALERRLRALASQPFELSTAPLVRAALVRLGPARHVLALAFHEVVCDAESAEIFARELFLTYTALGRADVPVERERAADYAAWVAAARAASGTGERGTKLAFLRERLAEVVSPLQLPADRPRPAVFSYRGASLAWRLPPELAPRLRQAAAERGAAAEALLFAAFAVLLHRYSGQERFAIGVPLRGRSAGFAEAIGAFENLGVVAADAAGAPSFTAYVERARAALDVAGDHADVPFEELVEALNAPRDLGRTALFQALFSFRRARPVDAPDGVAVALRDVESGFTRTDLCLYLDETSAGIAGRFEYSSDLFDRASVEQLADSFSVLLGAALSDPDTPIARLPLLDASARRVELERWNATELAYDRELTIVDRFEARVAETPAAPAVHFNGTTLSYSELNQRVNRLAHELVERGAAPGSGVAIALERSFDLVVSVLAVLKSGAHYVPLDPRHPEARNARILEVAAPRVIVSERSVEPLLPDASRDRRLVLEERAEALAARSAENPGRRAQASGVAYVLFTSGSTGDPKGVEVSHGALTNFLVSMAHSPGIQRTDRVLALTTISFDIAGLELYLPLTHGACVELVDTETAANPRLLAERIGSARPTLVQATPATWQMLLEVGWEGDPSIRALSGGEAMSLKLARQLSRRVGELWNMYGPTETTIWSALFRVSDDAESIPIGLPIHNTTIHVLDDALEPVPRGVVGELFIGGDGVAEGYHKNPELSAGRFVADPFAAAPRRLYRTGDLGRRRHDGRLEWLGRRDFQVKVRGFRIELGEIEAALVAHPAVELAVAGVQNDPSGDKRLVAHLMLKDRGTELPGDLRDHLAKRLPSYMVPSAMAALEAFPLTPNGKVDRKRLPEVKTLDRQERVAPRSDLELSVAKIWSTLLGVADVGTHDDFFQLGGHSLMAVRMLRAVREDCGVDVPLAAFFAKPTIADLAAIVREGGGKLRSSIVELSRSAGGRPFYFIAGIHLYQALADELGDDFRCSGMVLPIEQELFSGAADARADAKRFEVRDVARRYVELIRADRPEGPYWIGGVSFGGVVAYEVARMLRAEGADVELLVIIDSLLSGAARLDPRSWVTSRLREIRSDGVGRLFERARRKLWGAAAVAPIASDDGLDEETAFRRRRDRAYSAAAGLYEREPRALYGGRTLVVRAADAEGLEGYVVPPDLGWRERVSGELHLATVSGDHLGILRPPHVGELAAEIRRQLEPGRRHVAASAGGFGALVLDALLELDAAFQVAVSTIA